MWFFAVIVHWGFFFFFGLFVFYCSVNTQLNDFTKMFYPFYLLGTFWLFLVWGYDEWCLYLSFGGHVHWFVLSVAIPVELLSHEVGIDFTIVDIHRWTFESPAASVDIAPYPYIFGSLPAHVQFWEYSIIPAQISGPTKQPWGREGCPCQRNATPHKLVIPLWCPTSVELLTSLLSHLCVSPLCPDPCSPSCVVQLERSPFLNKFGPQFPCL